MKLSNNKVSNNIKEEFDSEPIYIYIYIYNEKYLKTKIKSYQHKFSAHIFTMITYEKNVLSVFVYQ